jgi:hypothetical protein
MVGADFQYLGHTMEIANQKLCVRMLILLQRENTHFYIYSLAGFLVDPNCSMLFLVHCSLVLVPVLSMPGMDLRLFILFGLRSYFICIGDI